MFAVQPPRTPYDVQFRIGNIPVRVHPFFWIVAVLLGASNPDPLSLLLWVVALFVSILVHELGHALAIIYYGWRPEITLYAFGGLASYNPGFTSEFASYSRRGNRSKGQIIISLAGPLAGFLVAGAIIALLYATNRSMPSLLHALTGIGPTFIGTGPLVANECFLILTWDLLTVNILWGLINLLPVYPLDGGQVSREIFLSVNPHDGVRQSLILSVAAGAAIAVLALVQFQDFFIAIMFGYLAFNSYQMLRFHSGGYGGGNPW